MTLFRRPTRIKSPPTAPSWLDPMGGEAKKKKAGGAIYLRILYGVLPPSFFPFRHLFLLLRGTIHVLQVERRKTECDIESPAALGIEGKEGEEESLFSLSVSRGEGEKERVEGVERDRGTPRLSTVGERERKGRLCGTHTYWKKRG